MNIRPCQSLIRKNDDELKNIKNFIFDDEFEVDTVFIPNSTYEHRYAKMANYKGYPLVLGGSQNAKLEMLVTTKSSMRWTQQIDYPYALQ